MAADAGVDDVELISANALHRRLTAARAQAHRRRAGLPVVLPAGRLYNHDAEDRDNLLHLGLTDQGEDVEINRRAAESDLLVYVNVNLVAMDGGHKSVRDRAGVVQVACKHHHNAKTMVHSHSFMDHTQVAPAPLGLADGPAAGRAREGLPDRDDAQQRRLPLAVPAS